MSGRLPGVGIHRAAQVHQVIRQGATLAMIVVVARSGLPLEEVGGFEGLRYVAWLLTMAWVQGVTNAYVRTRQLDASPERLYVFFLLIVLLGGVAVCAVFAYGLDALSALLLNGTPLNYGLAFGAFVLGTLAGSVVEHEAVADHAGARLLVYSATSYALQVLPFAWALWAGWPLAYAVWALSLSAVYRLGWAAVRFWRVADAQPPRREVRAAFAATASHLSVYGAAALAVSAVDHYLVTSWGTEPATALATWRYGSQEIPLLLGAVTALNVTSLAERRLGPAIQLANLRRRARRLTRLFMPLAVAATLASPTLFPAVFGPELGPAHVLFNTMLLIVPTRLVITTPLMIGEGLERAMTYVSLAETGVNVAVSLLLLPTLGLLGVAVGTVVAYAFERVAYAVVLRTRGVTLDAYVPRLELACWTGGLALAYAASTGFGSLLNAP